MASLRMNSSIFRTALCGAAFIFSSAAVSAADNAVVFQTCIEKAEQISRNIWPLEKRNPALAKIALAYARFGSFDRIEGIANEIREPRSKAEAILEAINYSKMRTESPEIAKRLTSIARDAAVALTHVGIRDNLFWRIAYRQALNGQIAESYETSDLVETPILQDQARYQISSAQSQNGDIDGALATAESMRPGRWRDDAFAVAAGAIAQAGDWKKARDVAEKSRSHKQSAYYFMANAGTQKLDFESRLAHARELPSLSLRILTLRRVGDDAIKIGDQNAARRSYREAYLAAQDSDGKSYQLSEIGVAQAKAGFIDDAAETAKALEAVPLRQRAMMNGDGLIWVLGYIAKAQYRVGQTEAARRTVESADQILSNNEYKNHSATLELVRMAAATGDIEFARRIAMQLPAPQIFGSGSGIPVQPHAWQIIAVQLAKSGDYDGALKMIGNIDHVYAADSALTQIAMEQIWQGNLAHALDTVARIGDARMQVLALTEMATAHTRPRPD
jgi:hypothetical protein